MPLCNASQRGQTGKEVLAYCGMSSFSSPLQTDTKTCPSELLLGKDRVRVGGREKTAMKNICHRSASLLDSENTVLQLLHSRTVVTSYVSISFAKPDQMTTVKPAEILFDDMSSYFGEWIFNQHIRIRKKRRLELRWHKMNLTEKFNSFTLSELKLFNYQTFKRIKVHLLCQFLPFILI